MDYIKQELIIYNSRDESHIKIEKAEPLKTEIAHFISCVQNGTQPLVDGIEGLNTLKVALKASEIVRDIQS